MSKMKRSALMFVIGGIGYGIIELIWRARTHPTMILAGGICFLAFSQIAIKFEKKPLLFKAILSAVTVTAVELVFGIIFNVIFKMHVWDYSTQPFNLFGQICLKFSFAWLLLGFLFVPLADAINKRVAR